MKHTNHVKIFSIISFLCCVLLPAQEIDPRFLNSLPAEMRSQLQTELDREVTIRSKENYRTPSTEIEKMALEERRELDEFERFKNNQKKSDIFGVSYFNTMQSSFMPINEAIFDPDYILGVDDVLSIQMTGQENAIIEQKVQRDGSINYPKIGKVFISGKKLSEVDEYFQNIINDYYTGTKVFITLSSLRDLRILVVGDVEYPGVYTLPGNANLMNVLVASGGPSDKANLRKINITRGGDTIRTVDLYKALIDGDFSEVNFPLRSGDTVLIKNSERSIRIQGGVNRPGIYELLPEEDFETLIKFANGFSEFANKEEIFLSSFIKGNIKTEVLDLDANPILMNNDVVSISEFKTINVKISGAVLNPGSYRLPIGYKISDLVNLAGGYEDKAYPFGGVFLNIRAAEVEQQALDRTKKDFLVFLSSKTKSASSQGNNDLETFLQQYENVDGFGRINTEFDLARLRANPDKDLELSDSDEVIIPRFTNVVYVFGEVSNPGTHVFSSELSAKDYIYLSGNKTEMASKRVVLIHPNGESEILERSSFFNSISSTKQFVYPGTLIYVPRDFELNAIEFANFYLPIVSNLAISLASLASIRNN